MKKKKALMCLSFLGLMLGSCHNDPPASSEGSLLSSSSEEASSSLSEASSEVSSSLTSVRETYTVIWMNGENALETDVVYADEAGKPSYDGTTPTKETDAQYIYTFDGWTISGSETVYSEADLPVISGNTTYIAHYSTETRKYNLVWKVGDTVLERDNDVPYGTHPSFEADENIGEDEEFNYFDDYETDEHTYTFDGWQLNGEGDAYTEENLPIVSGDTTYVAHFLEEARTYYVSWKNGDFTMETDSFEYGETPRFGINPPEKASENGYTYYFDGWTRDSEDSSEFYSPGSLPPVTSETTYYIHYGAIKDTGLNLLTNSSNNAVAVINDEAYIFKGSESSTNQFSNAIYKWNPTDGCVNTGVTQLINVRHQAAVACNGKIYLFGGETATNSALNTIYVYDPVAGTVTNTGLTMRTGRCSPRAVAIEDTIYVTGGYGGTDNSSVEAFDTVNNTIVDTRMNTDRSAGSTMAATEDYIFTFGRKDIVCGGIYSLDFGGTDATRMESNVIESLDYGTAVTHQGRIYTFGGTDYTDDIDHSRIDCDKVCCYDTLQDSYSDTNIRLPHALSHMSAAVIDEKIYVFGGESYLNGVTTYYNNVYEIIP